MCLLGRLESPIFSQSTLNAWFGWANAPILVIRGVKAGVWFVRYY